MLVFTTRLSCTRTAAVSATLRSGSLPPRADTISRAQYSPSGSPAGGVASNRTVWRSSGAMGRRRGKAWTHAAAGGNLEAGRSTRRRAKWASGAGTEPPGVGDNVGGGDPRVFPPNRGGGRPPRGPGHPRRQQEGEGRGPAGMALEVELCAVRRVGPQDGPWYAGEQAAERERPDA